METPVSSRPRRGLMVQLLDAIIPARPLPILSPAEGCSIIPRTRDESLSTLLRHVFLGAAAWCAAGGEGKGGKKGDAVVPRVYVCVGTTLSV